MWEGIVEVFDLKGHPKATEALCMGVRNRQSEEAAPCDRAPYGACNFASAGRESRNRSGVQRT